MFTLALMTAAQATNSTAGGCTKAACPFSYTNPSYSHEGRCGEVDAAPRMPADIWDDQRAVEEYVEATIKLYNVEGSELKQEACDHAGHIQRGGENVSWTSEFLMLETCGPVCHCRYPDCKDEPDEPKEHHYCSLCGPKFNAPIEVKFWYKGHGPAPGPSPGPSTVCKATEFCCPDAKKCLTPTSTSCGLNPDACGTGEVCCPLTKICVIPGADCKTPCADAGTFCCPDAKHCLTPVKAKAGLFCDPNVKTSCATGEVCCPLIKECVTVGAACTAP